MSTGITGYKGHVHFEIAPCVSIKLDTISPETGRAELLNIIKTEVDNSIHRSYRIYPCNYIAYDLVNGTEEYANNGYTTEEKAAFIEYVDRQLDKVDLEVTEEDRAYMRDMIYMMYSNPLKNKLNVLNVKQ